MKSEHKKDFEIGANIIHIKSILNSHKIFQYGLLLKINISLTPTQIKHTKGHADKKQAI